MLYNKSEEMLLFMILIDVIKSVGWISFYANDNCISF